jgi:WD40 repeat protein
LPYTWSDDGDVLAYWAFTPEEVKVDYTSPPGTLNFYRASTGGICQSAIKVGYPYSGNDPITWAADRQVIIQADVRFLEGTPCQDDFKPIGDQSKLTPITDPSTSLSPSGKLYAVNQDLFTSNLDAKTSVIDAKTNQVVQVIKWRHLDGEGPLPAPMWLNDNQFLIQSTLDRGPLLATVGQEAIEVAPKLFGHSSEVACTDTPCDTYLAAKAAILTGTSGYHIALYATGTASNFSKVLLYHSENQQVEELPFTEFGGFSPGGQAFIGYEEGYRAWIRAEDPISSEAHLFLSQSANPFPVRWSPDGNLLAVSSSDGISIFSIPTSTQIGFWNTGGYSIFPTTWSPNSEFLAVQGYLPNGGGEALFVIRMP